MLKRFFVYCIVGIYLFATVSVARSDGMINAAQSARQEAIEYIDNGEMPTFENGVITLPGGGTLNSADLFPGTSATNSSPAGTFLPEGYDPKGGEDVYGNDSAAYSEGSTTKTNLFNDANSDNPSTQGSAYSVLKDHVNIDRPDLTNDPVFGQTNDVLDDLESITDEFADCSDDTSFNYGQSKVHLPDLKYCNKVQDMSGMSTVFHDYNVGVIEHYSGPANLESCGKGCMKAWIGKVGDNYWDGSCKIFEQTTSYRVLKPEAITKVVLDYAKWDDYIQIYINNSKIYHGPNSNFPPETSSGACELSTSWQKDLNRDITSHFTGLQPGDVVSFKIRVSVTGAGEGYARLKINYDHDKVIEDLGWSPESGVNTIYAIDDGFNGGTFECVQSPTVTNGCAVVNGIKICEEDFTSETPPGISPFCQKVEVSGGSNFYEGDLECYEDINGDVQCPVNNGGNENTCLQYEENPQCGFISSECVDGAEGESGRCYNIKETWDCGTDILVDDAEIERNISCAGPVRCVGLECIDPEFGQSESFGKAAAILEVVSQAGNDMECQEDTTEDNRDCIVFGGDAGYCKIAVGGVQDCCESPEGVSLADYLTLMKASQRANSAFANASFSQGSVLNGMQSAYVDFTQPIADAVSSITNPFTSAIDSAVAQIKDTVMDALGDQFKNWIQDTFTQEAANSAAGSAGGGMLSGSGAAGAAGQVLSAVGTIFMYYQLAVLLIQIVWKCEKEELELNTNRELRQCHRVGSYCASEALGACVEERTSFCCFNSPLSRIIQEQARDQLDIEWGLPEEPECGGLTVTQIANLDWDKIDLSEWIAMLNLADLYPTPTNLGLERRTGTGSLLDYTDDRSDAVDRTLIRMEDKDLDGLRKEAQKQTPDPS